MSDQAEFYSKYDEWADNGRPYRVGVSLFVQLKRKPVLAKLLQSRENSYTRKQLDNELREHYAKVTGNRPAVPGSSPDVLRVATPVLPPEDSTATDATSTVEAASTMLDEERQTEVERPEDPTQPLSASKKKAAPYSSLPEVLQKGRLNAIDLAKERRRLHDKLSAGIDDELLSKRVAQDIVDLSDTISKHWDAEDAWVQHGTMPFIPQEAEAKYREMDDGQLERTLTNQLRPKRTRAQTAMRHAEGEKLVEAQARLTEAETEIALVQKIKAERTEQADAKAEAIKNGTDKT